MVNFAKVSMNKIYIPLSSWNNCKCLGNISCFGKFSTTVLRFKWSKDKAKEQDSFYWCSTSWATVLLSIFSIFWISYWVILISSSDEKIALLGAIQSLFEGSMYTFVFLWTPALSPNDEEIPHGFIFATFMLASMLGSSIAARLLARSSPRVESYMQVVFSISAASLLLPIVTNVCLTSNSYPIQNLICNSFHCLTFFLLTVPLRAFRGEGWWHFIFRLHPGSRFLCFWSMRRNILAIHYEDEVSVYSRGS